MRLDSSENNDKSQGTCPGKNFEFVSLFISSSRKIDALKYCFCKTLSLDTAVEGLHLLDLVAYICIHTDAS